MQEYNKTAGGKTKDKWQKNVWNYNISVSRFQKMKCF